MSNFDAADQILKNSNIVDIVASYIELRKKGNNYWGVCPFHSDSKPSLSVSAAKNVFKCFSCETSGNIISFVMKIEKITFLDALKIIAKKSGFSINLQNQSRQQKFNSVQQKILNLMLEIKNFFQYSLQNIQNKEIKNYLKVRNLNQQIIETFQIGYCTNDDSLYNFLIKKKFTEEELFNSKLFRRDRKPIFFDRIVFTITDQYGNVVGFSGRIYQKKESISKYINSTESIVFKKNEVLYNYYLAKEPIRRAKQIFIVEGFFDVIALYKAGFQNTVAIMGLSLSEKHCKLLSGNEINLFLDSDIAGINATLKLGKYLMNQGFKVYTVVNSVTKDADELEQTNKKELLKIINNRIPLLEFVFSQIKKRNQNLDNEKIKNYLQKFAVYLKFCDALTSSYYVKKFCNLYQIDAQIIKKHLLAEQTFKNTNYLPSENKFESKVNESLLQQEIAKNKEKIAKYQYNLIKTLMNHPDFLKLIKKDFRFTNNSEFDATLFMIKEQQTDKESSFCKNAQNLGKVIADEKEFIEFIKSFQKMLYNLQSKNLRKKLLNTSLSRKDRQRTLSQIKEIKKEVENY